MRVIAYLPSGGEVDLSGSADELAELATAVASGDAVVAVAATPPVADRDVALAEVLVVNDSQPQVLVRVDVERRALVIEGGLRSLDVLAGNIQGMADAEDGGHLHVDHYPDHPYLREGSVPLILNSPHGGMPAR